MIKATERFVVRMLKSILAANNLEDAQRAAFAALLEIDRQLLPVATFDEWQQRLEAEARRVRELIEQQRRSWR